MTENQAMSDDRRADLRRDVISQVASAGGRTRHSDAYAEMLDEIDRLRAENERLRDERRKVRELVRALRGMVVAAHEAGEIFMTVEFGEGGKLVLLAADRYLSGDELICDGCGAIPTSTHDADGNHLCRECGLTLMEDESCRCSRDDQCSCAYDCDCRERYEHVFEDDTRYGDEGWRNTGKPNPEPTS